MFATPFSSGSAGNAIRTHSIALAGMAFYLLCLSIQLSLVVAATSGNNLYLLDDSYIHAAIARNLVQHHVYGVTPFATVFASSSITWPILLAGAFQLFGIHASLSFVLNVFASLLCIFAADALFQGLAPAASAFFRTGSLALFILGVPLVGMTFIGMEHLAHLAFCLLAAFFYVRVLDAPSTATILGLSLATALATGFRYESLFLLPLLCIGLLVRRRFGTAALLGIAGLAPAILFALYMHAHSGGNLPATLLIKTSDHRFFLLTAWHNFAELLLPTAARRIPSISAVPSTFLLGGVLWLLSVFPRGRAARLTGALAKSAEILGMFLAAFLLHAAFARFGSFFRYEAYLLGLVIVAAGAVAANLVHTAAWQSIFPKCICSLMALCLLLRGAAIAYATAPNTRLIYEQQIQTARFLALYYPGHSVALNDIGATDFLTDLRIVDFYALGSPDVARLYATHQFDRQHMTELTREHQVEIAVLYPQFFAPQVPSDWLPVARFTVTDAPRTAAVSQNYVEFYAASPGHAEALARQVRAFQPSLPPAVRIDMLDPAH